MSQSTLKILFIDEKRITSDLEKAGYRKIGAQISKATNFAQAKETLRREGADVIVINFDYKEIDALSICEAFKKQDETAGIPIVFTSVQALPKRVSQRLPGPDLFIETPVPREYFIEQVRNLLEEKIRTTERVVHEGHVAFEVNGQNYECPIQDISKSGLLVATDLSLDPGTQLSLSFALPGYKKPVRVDGEVVRCIAADQRRDTKAGIGIRFGEFNGDSLKRLEKYIEKSQNDDPKLVYYL